MRVESRKKAQRARCHGHDGHAHNGDDRMARSVAFIGEQAPPSFRLSFSYHGAIVLGYRNDVNHKIRAVAPGVPPRRPARRQSVSRRQISLQTAGRGRYLSLN